MPDVRCTDFMDISVSIFMLNPGWTSSAELECSASPVSQTRSTPLKKLYTAYTTLSEGPSPALFSACGRAPSRTRHVAELGRARHLRGAWPCGPVGPARHGCRGVARADPGGRPLAVRGNNSWRGRQVCRLRVSYGGKFVQVRKLPNGCRFARSARRTRPARVPSRRVQRGGPSDPACIEAARSSAVAHNWHSADVVLLPAPLPLLSHAFRPVQDAGGQWRYQGGESHLESIPTRYRYADLMHRLAERCNGAVALKYFEPNDEMHPDNLLTVSDDDDLQVLIWALFKAACNTL